MANRLHENLSSRYVEAANKLRPKASRRKIIAYVESYDDIFFWRTVLSSLETPQVAFQVMLPSHYKRLEKKKKAVLMNLLGNRVGDEMIACVDADYDYLMQGATTTSYEVCHNPYIFHTYAYAIENLQCFAPALRDICVAVTLNDKEVFDFEAYLRQYSVIIFPLFVWSVWFYRGSDYGKFSITDFLTAIEIGNFSVQRAGELLERLRKKVGRKVDALRHQYPHANASWEKVRTSLLLLGVTPETTYLYIQGHHLFDKVVQPAMHKVCAQLVKEREEEIWRESIHGTQRRNELSCYSHSTADIAMMLRKSTGYLASNILERIREDIRSRVVQPVQEVKESGEAVAGNASEE